VQDAGNTAWSLRIAQANQFANSGDDIESDFSNVLLVVDNNLAPDGHWHQLYTFVTKQMSAPRVRSVRSMART
jgi:hypothetical protein